MNKRFILAPEPQVRSFTLLELVVVIIIIAVLAALGFTQYDKVVESARLTEARVRIGLMRTLATEYYYKYGSLDGIGNSDVDVGGMETVMLLVSTATGSGLRHQRG